VKSIGQIKQQDDNDTHYGKKEDYIHLLRLYIEYCKFTIELKGITRRRRWYQPVT
jgi:hypothetical protein